LKNGIQENQVFMKKTVIQQEGLSE